MGTGLLSPRTVSLTHHYMGTRCTGHPASQPLPAPSSNFNTHRLKALCRMLSEMCHTQALLSRGPQNSRCVIFTHFGGTLDLSFD